jgi:hypothetical protein
MGPLISYASGNLDLKRKPQHTILQYIYSLPRLIMPVQCTHLLVIFNFPKPVNSMLTQGMRSMQNPRDETHPGTSLNQGKHTKRRSDPSRPIGPQLVASVQSVDGRLNQRCKRKDQHKQKKTNGNMYTTQLHHSSSQRTCSSPCERVRHRG